MQEEVDVGAVRLRDVLTRPAPDRLDRGLDPAGIVNRGVLLQ